MLVCCECKKQIGLIAMLREEIAVLKAQLAGNGGETVMTEQIDVEKIIADTAIEYLDKIRDLENRAYNAEQACEKLKEAVEWMSGSEDFCVLGKARQGFETIVIPALAQARKLGG